MSTKRKKASLRKQFPLINAKLLRQFLISFGHSIRDFKTLQGFQNQGYEATRVQNPPST